MPQLEKEFFESTRDDAAGKMDAQLQEPATQ